jgi:tetraacyldisaccharide 4'-kinase
MRPWSATMSALTRARHKIYDMFPSSADRIHAGGGVQLPVVIGVGSVAVGGSGKTPVAMHLARLFAGGGPRDGGGAKVALVSNGYRSAADARGAAVRVAAGSRAEDVGDEAVMAHAGLHACGVAVWSGRDRAACVARAHAAGANVVVVDDVLQTRGGGFSADIYFGVVRIEDALTHFRDETFWPLGPLRDDPSRLARADIIYIVDSGRRSIAEIFHAKRIIETTWARPDVIIGLARIWFDAETVERLSHHDNVAIACAIARPENFIFSIRRARGFAISGEARGIINVLDAYAPRDHSSFDMDNLAVFARTARLKGASAIVVTTKDAARHPELDLDGATVQGLPVIVARQTVVISQLR